MSLSAGKVHGAAKDVQYTAILMGACYRLQLCVETLGIAPGQRPDGVDAQVVEILRRRRSDPGNA